MSERPVHPWIAEGQSSIRFAVVGAFLSEWEELRDFVVRAESLGFDAYWANDHPGRSQDCWSLLSALAMVTTRIRLMSLVACVYYRSPLMLARQAADVDRLSGGRLVLGLGIGDDRDEFEQLGLEFPPLPERHRALAEAVEIVHDAWSSARIRPGPVQEPFVPILIGGGGERRTLPAVARFADVSNFGPHEWTGGAFETVDVRRKYDVLRANCDEVGRPFDSILRSHWTPLLTLAEDPKELERKRDAARIPDAALRTAPLFATVDEAIAHYQGLADAGVQYFLATINGHDSETADLLAERVLPALRPS